MDEHSAWNRWLLRHGRLVEALLLGLLVFGILLLPKVIYWLLAVPVDWRQVLGTVIGAGFGALVWGLSRGDQPHGDLRLSVTVSSRRKRGLLALGYGAGTGLFAAVRGPSLLAGLPYPPMFSAADLTARLLAGGASVLWIAGCVLLLVPLGPPSRQAIPGPPGTAQELSGQRFFLLGLVVVLLVIALGFLSVSPLMAGFGGFWVVLGAWLLGVALVRGRRARAH